MLAHRLRFVVVWLEECGMSRCRCQLRCHLSLLPEGTPPLPLISTRRHPLSVTQLQPQPQVTVVIRRAFFVRWLCSHRYTDTYTPRCYGQHTHTITARLLPVLLSHSLLLAHMGVLPTLFKVSTKMLAANQS